jgi:hypothetical protein
MTLWDHLCCIGYGIEARCSGVWHWLRGHDLRWRVSVEPWVGCTGDIQCFSCADSSDGRTDVAIWCRHWTCLWIVAKWLCAQLGHEELKRVKRHDAISGEMVACNEWYCTRCCADVEKPIAEVLP